MVASNVYPFRKSNSTRRKDVGFAVTNIKLGTSDFAVFRERVVESLNFLIQGSLLKTYWKASVSDTQLLLRATRDTANHKQSHDLNISFSVPAASWLEVTKLNNTYMQALVQYLMLSLLSVMADVVQEPQESLVSPGQEGMCRSSVELFIDRLLHPTARCVQVQVSRTSADAYYTNVAAVLEGIAGGEGTVTYDAGSHTLTLKTTESVDVNVDALRGCEEDMFIMNANIAAAFVMCIKKHLNGTALLRALPSLVDVYCKTRGAQPVAQRLPQTHNGLYLKDTGWPVASNPHVINVPTSKIHPFNSLKQGTTHDQIGGVKSVAVAGTADQARVYYKSYNTMYDPVCFFRALFHAASQHKPSLIGRLSAIFELERYAQMLVPKASENPEFRFTRCLKLALYDGLMSAETVCGEENVLTALHRKLSEMSANAYAREYVENASYQQWQQDLYACVLPVAPAPTNAAQVLAQAVKKDNLSRKVMKCKARGLVLSDFKSQYCGDMLHPHSNMTQLETDYLQSRLRYANIMLAIHDANSTDGIYTAESKREGVDHFLHIALSAGFHFDSIIACDADGTELTGAEELRLVEQLSFSGV